MQKSFKIKSSTDSYPVFLGSDFYKNYLSKLDPNSIIICDQLLVEKYQLESLPVKLISIEAKEDNKDLSNISEVICRLKDHQLKRGGLLVGIGGGIIQDITCFVASIYMRGVDWAYFPTTFLGMCDSCIGGKSSINVLGIKNLVGNFYPPKEIYIDLNFAKSLNSEQIDSGISEAIKICFARNDVKIFEKCCALLKEKNENYLFEIAALTLETKKWFIEIDEFDKKERQLLNFGHTFGHAIEGAANFAIPHGIAVAYGMLWAIYFSSMINNFDHKLVKNISDLENLLMNLLKSYDGFIGTIKTLDSKIILSKFISDKKHKTNQYVCILPNKDGFLEITSIEKNDDFLKIFKNSFEELITKFK